MKYYIVVAGASATLIATAYLASMRRTTRNDVEIGQLRGVVHELSARIQSAETPPRPVPAVIDSNPTVSNTAGSARAATTHAIPPDLHVPAAAAPSLEDRRAFLELSFSRQPADVGWSKKATQQVREIFNAVNSRQTSVRSVDCRSTLCRAELEHENEGEAHHVLNQLLYMNPEHSWNGAWEGGKQEVAPDGTTKNILFFAREGTAMPALD